MNSSTTSEQKSSVPSWIGLDEFGRTIDLTSVFNEHGSAYHHLSLPSNLHELADTLWPLDMPIHSQLLTSFPQDHRAAVGRQIANELTDESKYIEDSELRQALLIHAKQAQEGNIYNILKHLESAANVPQIREEECAHLWIEHGLILEQELLNLEDALASYMRALSYSAKHPVALVLAIDAAVLLHRSEIAHELLHTALDIATSHELKTALLLDLYELTKESDQRIQLLEQAVALTPTEPISLRRLIRELRKTENIPRLVALYGQLAELTQDPISKGTALVSALTLLVDSNAELIHKLKALISAYPDPSSTIVPLSELVRHLQKQDSEYMDVLGQLIAIIPTTKEQLAIRQLLCQQRWKRMEEQRQKIQENNADSQIKTRITHESLELKKSYQILIRDLQFFHFHRPESYWVNHYLATAFEENGDIDALRMHVEAWALRQPIGLERAEILLRLGKVYENFYQNMPHAAEIYSVAVANAPLHTDCLRSLGHAFEKLKHWEQALTIQKRQAQQTPEMEQKISILHRIAMMAEHKLGDMHETIATLQQIIDIDQGDSLSLYHLAALCRAHERTDILLHTLTLLVERIDDQVACTAAYIEIAKIYETKLADQQSARLAYEQALRRSPGYYLALRGLAHIYRETRDWNALLKLQDPEIDPISSPAILALKTSRICLDEMGDSDLAIKYLFIAYQQNPDWLLVREHLTSLLIEAGRYQEAYDVLRSQEIPEDPRLRANFYFTLGELAEELAAIKTKQEQSYSYKNAALQCYRATLSAQPEHGLAFVHARNLLVAHGDLSNLILLLENQIAHEPSHQKLDLLIQLARLHLHAPPDYAKARRYYEQAIELAPNNGMIQHEFENLLRYLNSRRSLPTLRLALARISEDTHYKATLLLESAELLIAAGTDDDQEFAMNALLGALREDPGNPFAVLQLDQLLFTAIDPLILKDAIRARTVRAQSDLERAIFYLENGELLEQANSVDAALKAYHSALRAIPGLEPANYGIARLTNQQTLKVEIPKIRAVSIHSLMAEARSLALNLSDSSSEDTIQRTLDLLQQILARDPNYRYAISLLRTLGGRLSNPQPALRLLGQTFPQISDANLRYEVGVFLGEQDIRAEEAIVYLQSAAAIRPEGKQALQGLVCLYQKTGEDDKAAWMIERLLPLYNPSDPIAIELRLDLATFLSRFANTLGRALEHTTIVLKARNDDLRAILLMADILEKMGRHAKAVDVLTRVISREQNQKNLHTLYIRKSQLLSHLPESKPEMLESLEKAAALDPYDYQTMGILITQLEKNNKIQQISNYVENLRTSLIRDFRRGKVPIEGLRLLESTAHYERNSLAEISKQLRAALEPSSQIITAKRSGPEITFAGIQRLLNSSQLMSLVLSREEPAEIHELLTYIESSMQRLLPLFLEGLRRERFESIPANVDPNSLHDLLQNKSITLGTEHVALMSTRAPDLVALMEEGKKANLLLSANLWLSGDKTSWRGLATLAFARKALGGARIRALAPTDMDLVIAASFEITKVFNTLVADPDAERLRNLSNILSEQLSRNQRKELSRICESLAVIDFSPGSIARATQMSDLHMSVLLSSDLRSCLSAACILNGLSTDSLMQRVSMCPSALDLLEFLISDEYLSLREVVTTDTNRT